jgi:hypothetical protein
MPTPDAPDFDRLALAVFDDVAKTGPRGGAAILRTALVRIWNARGAADVAALERELSTVMGPTMAGPYIKNCDRALRALDR